MKRWMVILLLLGRACAETAKPYDGVDVEVRHTYTVNNVLRIEAVDTHAPFSKFMFECSVGQKACVAPKVGKIYVVLKPQEDSQVCDNYTLGRELEMPVCLTDVEKD